MHLEGKLDRANYEILIDEAQDLFSNGARDLILDMNKLTFISSAGVTALHQVALLFREEKHPRMDVGWKAFRSEDRGRSDTTQEHVKLFSPSGVVREVLNLAGFGSLFEIFTDLTLAAESFSQPAPEMGGALATVLARWFKTDWSINGMLFQASRFLLPNGPF